MGNLSTLEKQAVALAPATLALLQEFAGKEYALTRADMCGRLHCTDRVLRAAIAELRRQGHLVVAQADEGGYRLARSWAEVTGYTASLKSRIQSLQEIIGVMETTARTRFGPAPAARQEALF
jgi:hypothetical protein